MEEICLSRTLPGVHCLLPYDNELYPQRSVLLPMLVNLYISHRTTRNSKKPCCTDYNNLRKKCFGDDKANTGQKLQDKDTTRSCWEDEKLLKLSRQNVRLMIQLVTGHCKLKTHIHTFGPQQDITCRGCGEEEKMSLRSIYQCEAASFC